MFVGYAKASMGLKTADNNCNVFSITSISSKLPRVKARTFTNQTKLSEVASLETAGGLPGAFTASPASQMLPVVWYWDFSRLIFWFFFFGASLLVGLFCFAWLQTVVHAEFRQPLRETRGLSRAQVGDVITAVIPLTWSITMLMHASAHSSNFDETTTGAFFTIQILGYQWGWNYYLPMDLLSEWNSLPIEVGHGAWVQPQHNTSYDLLLARSRSEYWRRFSARGEWAAANGRFSVATAAAVFAAPQNTNFKITARGAILPQLTIGGLVNPQTKVQNNSTAITKAVGRSADAQLALTGYYRTATLLTPSSKIVGLTSTTLTDVSNLDLRLRAGYNKQITRAIDSLQNVSNRLTLIHKWLQPRYGLVIKEWRGHNSGVTKQLLISRLLLSNASGSHRSLLSTPAWVSSTPIFKGAIQLSNISPRASTLSNQKHTWFVFNNKPVSDSYWLASSTRAKNGKIVISKSDYKRQNTISGAKLGSGIIISNWTNSKPNTESSKALLNSWAILSNRLSASLKQKGSLNNLYFQSSLLSSVNVKLLESNKFLFNKQFKLINKLLQINAQSEQFHNYTGNSDTSNNFILYNQNLLKNIINVSGKPIVNANNLLTPNGIVSSYNIMGLTTDLQFNIIFPKLNWLLLSNSTKSTNTIFNVTKSLNLIDLVPTNNVIVFNDVVVESSSSWLLSNKLLFIFYLYNEVHILYVFSIAGYFLKLSYANLISPTLVVVYYLSDYVKRLSFLLSYITDVFWNNPIKQSLLLISHISYFIVNLLIIAGAFQSVIFLVRLLIMYTVLNLQSWLLYKFNRSLFIAKVILALVVIHFYIFAIADVRTYHRHGMENFIMIWKIELTYWWTVLLTMLIDTGIAIVLTLAKWLLYIVTYIVVQLALEIYAATNQPIAALWHRTLNFIMWSSKLQSNIVLINIRLLIRITVSLLSVCLNKLAYIYCKILLRKEIVTNIWVNVSLRNYSHYVNNFKLNFETISAIHCYSILVTKILLNQIPLFVSSSLTYSNIRKLDNLRIFCAEVDNYNLVTVKRFLPLLLNWVRGVIQIYSWLYLHIYVRYFTCYIYIRMIIYTVISKIFKFLIYVAIVPIYAPLAKVVLVRYIASFKRHFTTPTVPYISINEIFMITWDVVMRQTLHLTLLNMIKNQINVITNVNTLIVYVKLINVFILANCKLLLNQVGQTITVFHVSKFTLRLLNKLAGLQLFLEVNKLKLFNDIVITKLVALLKFNSRLTTLQLAANRAIIKINLAWFEKNNKQSQTDKDVTKLLVSSQYVDSKTKTLRRSIINTQAMHGLTPKLDVLESTLGTIELECSQHTINSVPQLNNQLESLEGSEFIPSVENTGISQHKLVDSLEREQVAARVLSDHQYALQTVELLDWRGGWYIEAALETQPTERLYHSTIAKRPQTGVFASNLVDIENVSARDVDQLRATIAGLGNSWHQGSQAKLVVPSKQLRLSPAVLDTEAYHRLSIFAKTTPQPGLDLDTAFLSQKWSKDFTVSRTVDHTQRYRSTWGPLYLALRSSYTSGLVSHSFRNQGGHEAAFLPWPKRAAKHMLSHWGWQRNKTSVNPTSRIRLSANSTSASGLSSTKVGSLTNWGILWTQSPTNSRGIEFVDSNRWWTSEVRLALSRWELLGLRSVNRGTLVNQLYATRARSWSNNALLVDLLVGVKSDNTTSGIVRKSQAYLPLTEQLNNSRRLRVTARFCLPSDTAIHAIFSARDVIHTWNVPLLNVKVDCIPGFSSHRRLLFRWRGFAVGQCAEVCGRYHHQMAIAVDIVSPHLFIRWVAAHMQVADSSAASERKSPNLPNPRWLAAALCSELSVNY